MADDVAARVLESLRDARSFTSSVGGVGVEVSAGDFDLKRRDMTRSGWRNQLQRKFDEDPEPTIEYWRCARGACTQSSWGLILLPRSQLGIMLNVKVRKTLAVLSSRSAWKTGSHPAVGVRAARHRPNEPGALLL